MRVVLLHNPAAGSEDHSAAQLIGEITRAGHDVVARVGRRKELAEALDRGCDLVVAAGGDGTVAKAAKVLAGTTIPLAVVPLGTANNIAYTLGAQGSLSESIGAWRDSEVRGFDLATVTTADESIRFVEAFGYGAFPRVMSQTEDDEDDVGDRLTRDRLMLRARLASSPPRHYRIHADGQDYTGDYFLVEVLNIPVIGPRVAFAPAADPGDGKLDLVLAGDEDRARLLECLDRMIGGGPPESPLRSIQAEWIRIAGEMRRHHVDGELHDEPTSSAEVTVKRHALRVLAAPAASLRRGSLAS